MYQWWVPPIRILPPLLITRILTDLQEYLTFRGDGSGVELVSWYHRQFWEAAKEWLFHRQDGGSEQLRFRHVQMADYFEGKWAHVHKVYSDKLKTQVQKFFPGEESADRMVPAQPRILHGNVWNRYETNLQLNFRRLNELVHHLILSEDEDRTVEELRTPEYIAVKFVAGDGAKLMRELNEAIAAFPRSSEELRVTKAALGRGLQDLERLPVVYFLQLASQLPNKHPVYQAAQPLIDPGEGNQSIDTPLICDWINKPQAFDKCMLIVRDHSASVNSVAFSPDGTWFCSASKDKTIRVHDGVSGELKMVLQGHVEDVRSVAISKDSRWFATAGLSGLLRIWDAHSGVQTLLFKELENTAINAVGFSCDSSWLAAAGENGVCICFNVIGTSSCYCFCLL